MLFAVIWLVDASWGRALNITVRVMRNLSSDSSSKRPFHVATTVGIYQSHIPISCTAFPSTIIVARVRSLVLETVLVIGRGKIACLVHVIQLTRIFQRLIVSEEGPKSFYVFE